MADQVKASLLDPDTLGQTGADVAKMAATVVTSYGQSVAKFAGLDAERQSWCTTPSDTPATVIDVGQVGAAVLVALAVVNTR